MSKFLRRPAVSARYDGLPASTLYDWISKGLFPRPIRLGARAVGWRIEDLEAWERSRQFGASDLGAGQSAGRGAALPICGKGTTR